MGYKGVDFEKSVWIVIYWIFFIAIVMFLLKLVGLDFQFWNEKRIGDIYVYRFRFFFYEPSIYSLSIIPFVVFGLTDFFQKKDLKNKYIKLFVCLFPLLLSQSAGVIAALIGAYVIVDFKNIFMRLSSRNMIFLISVLLMFMVLGVELIERYKSVASGNDHSGLVRTFYSMYSSFTMISEYDRWFGLGPGQYKYMVQYYNEYFPGFSTNRLPNSIASTMASVGFVGLLFKFIVLIFLFVFTKSYKYMYSKLLFVFMFIYQFTAGYFVNINEYVVYAYLYGYATRQVTGHNC